MLPEYNDFSATVATGLLIAVYLYAWWRQRKRPHLSKWQILGIKIYPVWEHWGKERRHATSQSKGQTQEDQEIQMTQ